MDGDLQLYRARSVREAVTLLEGGRARVAAGGTDLAGSLRIDGPRVDRVISLTDIEELRGIGRAADGGVRIGALATLAEVSASPLVQHAYSALAQAAACSFREETRARATLGGSVCQRPRCWYLRSESTCARKGGEVCLAADGENAEHSIFGGDLCHMVHPSDVGPALVALGASARIAGPAGTRTVAFEDFFLRPTVDLQRENVLGPAEILTDILLPPLHADSRSTYRRVSDAGAEWALASVAVSVIATAGVAEQTRIVLGAAAPVPWRAREAEAILDGFQIDRMLIAEAVEAAMADAMPLAENRYKVGLFRAILVDALEDVWELRPMA